MSHYQGTKCLTGAGLDKSFDYEIFDTYVNPEVKFFAVCEELFQFFKDRYGVDYIIKRVKDKDKSINIIGPM